MAGPLRLNAETGGGRLLFPFFCLLALAVTAGFFGRFINNFFAYDDFAVFERLTQGPFEVLMGYNYMPRFVANSIWWPLNALSGFSPFGYNLFGMVLWLANSILLFRLLARLFADRWLAFLSGTVFVATAVGSDVVFWRAANSTLLNLAFYLLALHAYVVFRQGGERRQWWLCLGFFTLAVFSKEEAASLPLVVILLELMFLGGRDDWRGVAQRFLMLSSVVVFYLLFSYFLIYQMLGAEAEVARYSSFRLLRSLFGGWSVFFLGPDSRIGLADPRPYLAAALVLASALLAKDRRLVLFGLGWVFLTFLPQSLSTLTQLEPRYTCNSLSRHLYLPAVGMALVYGALLAGLRQRFSARVAGFVMALALALYIGGNGYLVWQRGAVWWEEGEPMRAFIATITREVPKFPPQTFVFVNNPPSGRAFVQQALRAVYRTREITWITDPQRFIPKPGDTALLIDCRWQPDGSVQLDFQPWQ